MNAEDSLKLARRFIGLPLEKRQMFLAALHKEGVDFARFPIPAGVEAEDRQALSYAQQRMWFLWQLDPQSGAYNLPGAVRLTGRLNLPALEQAFASLVARHETLRTVFQRRRPTTACCKCRPRAPLVIDQVDFSALPATRARAGRRRGRRAAIGAAVRSGSRPVAARHLAQARRTGTRAAADPAPHRLRRLVDERADRRVHPLLRRLRCRRSDRNCAPLPIQYSDYALWQRRWLEAGEQARQLDYWQAQLGDEHPVLELPTDHPRPAMPSYRGTRYEFAVDAATGRATAGHGAEAQHHPVHAAARRLQRAAAPLHRADRHPRRRADRQPQPRRNRRPDRLLRQHPGAAHPTRRPDPRRRTAARASRKPPWAPRPIRTCRSSAWSKR